MNQHRFNHGDEIGDFTITCEEPFSLGSFGSAYLARNTLSGRTTYLKVLEEHERIGVNEIPETLAKRFILTSDFAERVHNDRLRVLFHRSWYRGLPLLPVIDRDHPETSDQAQRIDPDGEIANRLRGKEIPDYWALFRDLAEAALHARRERVPYGFINPYNIFYVAADDRFWFLDLGLDYALEKPGYSFQSLPVQALEYLPPERLRALKVGSRSDGAVEIDERSDVYSVGMTAYRLLSSEDFRSGRLPVAAKSPNDLYAKVSEGKNKFAPLPLRPFNQRAQAIIAKCIEKNPANRYESLQELIDAIDQLTADIGPEPQVPDPKSVLTRVLLWGGAALVVLALAAGIWWYMLPLNRFLRSGDYDSLVNPTLQVGSAEEGRATYIDNDQSWGEKMNGHWAVQGLLARLWFDGSDLTDERNREALDGFLTAACQSAMAFQKTDVALDVTFWQGFVDHVYGDPERSNNSLDLLNKRLEGIATPEAPETDDTTQGEVEKSHPIIPSTLRESIGGCLCYALAEALEEQTGLTPDSLEKLLKDARESDVRPKVPDFMKRWPVRHVMGLLARKAEDHDRAAEEFLASATLRPRVWAMADDLEPRHQHPKGWEEFLGEADQAKNFARLRELLEPYTGEESKGKRQEYADSLPYYFRLVEITAKALESGDDLAKASSLLLDVLEGRFIENYEIADKDLGRIARLLARLTVDRLTKYANINRSVTTGELTDVQVVAANLIEHGRCNRVEQNTIENKWLDMIFGRLWKMNGPPDLTRTWELATKSYGEIRPITFCVETTLPSDWPVLQSAGATGEEQRNRRLHRVFDLLVAKSGTLADESQAKEKLDLLWTAFAVWQTLCDSENPTAEMTAKLLKPLQEVLVNLGLAQATQGTETSEQPNQYLEQLVKHFDLPTTPIPRRYEVYSTLARSYLRSKEPDALDRADECADRILEMQDKLTPQENQEVLDIKADVCLARAERAEDTERLPHLLGALQQLELFEKLQKDGSGKYRDTLWKVASEIEKSRKSEEAFPPSGVDGTDYRRCLKLALEEEPAAEPPTSDELLYRLHMHRLMEGEEVAQYGMLLQALRITPATINDLIEDIRAQKMQHINQLREAESGREVATLLAPLVEADLALANASDRLLVCAALDPEQPGYLLEWCEGSFVQVIPAERHPLDYPWKTGKPDSEDWKKLDEVIRRLKSVDLSTLATAKARLRYHTLLGLLSFVSYHKDTGGDGRSAWDSFSQAFNEFPKASPSVLNFFPEGYEELCLWVYAYRAGNSAKASGEGSVSSFHHGKTKANALSQLLSKKVKPKITLERRNELEQELKAVQ